MLRAVVVLLNFGFGVGIKFKPCVSVAANEGVSISDDLL